MQPFAFSPCDTIYWAECRSGSGDGWEGGLQPFGPVSMSPAAAVLSYGLGVFEGLKAHRTKDGRVLLFRPQANADRFIHSASQMMLLPFPADRFVTAVEALVQSNLRHVPPHGEGSLYIRPIELATEPRLGVAPCAEHSVLMYAAPVGAYFSSTVDGLALRVLHQSRVPPGGSGSAKAIGNYAGCMCAVHRWRQEGYHDVLFMDARGEGCVTEISGANLFAMLRTGRIVTPALDDQVLPGITRDSTLRIAREVLSLTVEERPLPLSELLSEADEVFCTGTAYSVQSVAALHLDDRAISFPGREIARSIREVLCGIQRGQRADPFGWTVPVEVR